MADYTRPKEGFRFRNGGLRTSDNADALPDGKYAALANVRATRDQNLHTRPGVAQLFLTGGDTNPITDITTLTQIQTDNQPRVLTRSLDDQIYNDTGTSIGSLNGANPRSLGAAMIPFRPAESPQPYAYIANGSDYQKFTATGGQANAGIAEAQAPVDAVITATHLVPIAVNGTWTPGGTAGALSFTPRSTDVVQHVFLDPFLLNVWSVGVSPAIQYSRFEVLLIGPQVMIVQDVFPAGTASITVAGVYYFSGTNGRCVIVPQNIAKGPGQDEASIFTQSLLSNLRRGAQIKLSGGNEVCLVYSSSVGPDGTIAIEAFTDFHHTAGETLTVEGAIQVVGGTVLIGENIQPPDEFSTITTGIGTITSPALGPSPFATAGFSFQPDDYLHFSVIVNNLANLNEIKLLIDVGDGTFTGNFYYYTVRPNDIAAGVQNTLTQLGVAQLVSQRATIDEGNAAESQNQGQTASSGQTDPGSNQWSEIIFPISSLTRVGSDQTKSLLTATKMQVLVNASGTVQVGLGYISISGGGQPDVGLAGAPYKYLMRPRSSVTGAKGNPTPPMRYGVNPFRQAVQVKVPSAAYDPQIDTWDVFRYGGTVTSYRFIGTAPAGATSFLDNYSDAAALAGEAIEYDNLEPWPSIDRPFRVTNGSVVGTTALVQIPTFPIIPININLFLPGNKVQINNQNVYTLWTRPTFVSSSGGLDTWLFQFVENAGVGTNLTVNIYEPEIARQHLPYMWGPDAEGTVFACGDALRPGTISYSKNFAPDSAPDSYNIEVTPPTEPMLGGETMDGLSFCASPERWWAMYPTPENPAQRYNLIQQPWPRGLAAPYGVATDGQAIYWWAKDGIWSSRDGSLTDADLYNLFPHDGVPGRPYTYNIFTLQPPDYSRAASFRLVRVSNFLYASYLDVTGAYNVLVYDLRFKAWSVDQYATPVSALYHPPQPEGTLAGTFPADYPMLLLGTVNGQVGQQQDNTNDLGQPINGIISTREFDGGDIRAGEQWGDMMVDLAPAATQVTFTPMASGAPVAGTAITVGFANHSRQQYVVSLGGEVLSNFLGVQLQWIDDFATQSSPTTFYIWQPSFLPKPETISDRVTDWSDGGATGARFYQGFLLRADTFNQVKGMIVRGSDQLVTHAFTPQVLHNGESVHAYSFVAPFVSHSVRLEPTDTVPWRFFDVEWISEPTPELAETWQTQGTSFGLPGYSHVPWIVAAYAALAPVALTITTQDGQSPMPVNLPATGGAYQKLLVRLTANKGQLYFFQGQSSAPWQAWWDDWEIMVGNWGRSGPYVNYRSLGGRRGDSAHI